jgi:A/G-specific adenine glycosylase
MVVEGEAGVSHKILLWYEAAPRDLPWRTPPGQPLPLADPDWPYRVWLSEIMLQQTTVAAVKPYFERFTRRWPSVAALAAANDGDVMAAWAGLGYYARARNLLACARLIAADNGGRFPDSEKALLSLPGVGSYTAAAIASIAFGKRAVVVDGNVERVIARLYAVDTPLPAAKPELRRLTDRLTPDLRAGDHAQAMMDLGATLCTPRSPTCSICPVMAECKGRARATDFPVRAPKKAKPHRGGICWWIEHEGHVFLVRRDAKRMLGGMRALPSDDWDVKKASPSPSLAGEGEGEGEGEGTITHIFTHFSLALEIRVLPYKIGCTSGLDGEWWPLERLDEAGLPSLFAKAAHAVLDKAVLQGRAR